MTFPADIFRLVVTALVSALIGGAAGYALAWYRLRRTRLSIIENRRVHRTERLAWHRERYQESTSRIHRPAGPALAAEGPSDEALEQLRLEMMLLKEDHRIETQLLKEENEELRSAVERSRASEASFMDLVDDETLPAPVTAEAPEDGFEVIEPEVVMEEEAEVEAPELDEPVETEAEPVAEMADDKSMDWDSGEPLAVEHATDETPAETLAQSEIQAESEIEADLEIEAESEMETASALRGVPEDIRALFLESSLREKLFPKKSSRPEKRAKRTKPASPGSREDSSPSRPAIMRDLPGKPMEQDADGFHFHWEAPRPQPVPAPKARHASEPQRMDVPAFRSLYDMLQASGVSLSEDAHTASAAPDMDPVHRIVGLDRESYALLVDLGYASLEQLASLSDAETRRLAAVFRISPDRIRHEWTPSAKATLQENQPENRDQGLT